jgi:subtilisin family serine protease
VSISLGASPVFEWSDTTKQWIWYDELDLMRQNGVIVCAAAGNFGYDVEPPADGPGVFAVGATDSSDVRWYYSAYGGRLDFVAPAGGHPADKTSCPDTLSNFWTLDIMGDTGFVPWQSGGECGDSKDFMCRGTGTSVAAPQVAGVAALILSRRPDFIGSGDARTIVYDILQNTCDDLGTAGKDTEYGYGRINAFRALCAVSRGDVDCDGVIDILDCIRIYNEVFRGYPPPALYPGLSDANCDGVKDINDYYRVWNYVMNGAAAPPICYLDNY